MKGSVATWPLLIYLPQKFLVGRLEESGNSLLLIPPTPDFLSDHVLLSLQMELSLNYAPTSCHRNTL